MPHLPTLKGGSPRTAKPVFVYVVRTERRIRWIRRRVQPLTVQENCGGGYSDE
jgi:hypothetical protein